ncbi:MAG: hypothetical protein IKN16_01320 [Selenomonadaceae bacterium]|nr:hypothetical protein [Selenomonadaceae bacterium]
MFGKIQLEQFTGLTSMPQDFASAWSGSGVDQLVGASYKPLMCVGKQQVKGTNYIFLAEQKLIVHPPLRRVVKLTINKFGDAYELVDVEEI